MTRGHIRAHLFRQDEGSVSCELPLMTGDNDRHLPAWLANEVVDILRGEAFERDEPRFEPNPNEPGLTDVVGTVRFACGCIASDRVGWSSCKRGLHALLADASARSRFVDDFRHARSAFDAVLAEAWRKRGGAADNSIEFQAARQRDFTSFERWSSSHDLVGAPIWKDGFLCADLRTMPHDEDIRLFWQRDAELTLDWTCEGRTTHLPHSAEDAKRVVFTSDRTVTPE